MLIRPHDDASNDETRWRTFVAEQGFGHFIASGRGRSVPVAVPTQFLLHDDRVLFHLAKSNPVFDCLAENPSCLLSVAGDWAYIPGSWKAIDSEDPRRGIPTTYYGAVQLTGRAEVIDEPEPIAKILRGQLTELEPEGDYVDPTEHGANLKVIRGIVFTIDEVRAKFKYGGNVDDAHRELVAQQLQSRSGPGDAAARRQMPSS